MQNLSINGFRLSPQQKCLWLLQQSASAQPYRAHCAVLIEGNLSTNILEFALQKVVDRHEILRTAFHTLLGMTLPLQVITDNKIPEVFYYNLSGLEPEEQDTKIESLFQEASQRTFDFEQGQIFDVSLVVLSAEKHVLLVGLPAICADTATLNNLVREISRSYAACLHKQELSDQPLQYVDLAEWQNELFEGEEAEIGIAYWQQKDISLFADWKFHFENKTVLDLEFEPKFISLTFTSETIAKLEAIAQRTRSTIAQSYDASISVILQACWLVLLWRLTGESEVIVGTLHNGRNYEELESALGLFAKYLPIDCYLEENYKFIEVLNKISEARSSAFKWQESFSRELIKGKPLGSSFFPVCFDFDEQPAAYSAADLSFSIYKQYVCIDRFKVKLSCIRRDDALIAEFHYDANLFQVEDIWRLAGQFQTLLESVINQPEAAIGELEILSANEQHQLLIEFNNTQTEYPKHQCIHQLFEDWAAKTPEQIAVVFEDQQLTYAQLNARANQLAHHLQALGVGRETIVALCVDRSLEMLVGLLGILKAGGAYLPLDPILPDERLAFMVKDAGASVILTQQHLAQRLSKPSTSIVCLDANREEIARQPEENPHSDVTPENLVYVIYTSGSTGKPKGVAIEHRQLLNYLHGILARLDLPIGSSFATVSTIAADLGNTAIFPALCTGGCLHVISQERATNPEALAEYCEYHAIDCLKIVSSHLNALLSAAHPEKIMPRKRLILGGEALSWQLVEKIRQYAPNCQILNHYGPTETTIGVLTYPVRDESMRHQSETVPLGRAIANTQVYILRPNLRPVPIGVPGELYIGGDSLARGYLNQPELTSERFIRNPFSIQEKAEDGRQKAEGSVQNPQSSRLYKTGDLARYLPNGNIEFLGRIDHQVKIHGFRIELSEIESVLSQHPAIRETIVLAREDEPDKKRLVAYMVPNGQFEFSVSDLRNFLKEKLPEYMIPSAFVRLKALPLTPNGKVDRQALPAPDSIKPELEGRFVAPRTPVEETIARIWTQVLGRDKVGIYDNFFELGGDSIASIQIVARLNQAGLQLTPKQMFEYPTVAGLAAVTGTTPIIETEQGVVTGSLPLTPIQHWFFEQKRLHPHHWNQAVLLEVRQAIVPALLEQAVHHLLKHHDALRLRFTLTESGWQQVNGGLEDVDYPPNPPWQGGNKSQELASPPNQSSTFHSPNNKSLSLSSPLDKGGWGGQGGNKSQKLASPQNQSFSFHSPLSKGGWGGQVPDVPVSFIDLSSTPAAEQETALDAIATQLQASLNLENGSLMRVALFNLGDNQPNRLLWVIHHLAVDSVSWRILLEDFAHAYQQLERGEAVQLPPKTTSFKQWSEFLQEYAQSTELQQEQDYWLQNSRQSYCALPIDHPGGGNAVALARTVSISLTVEETRALLQEVPAVYRTQINDVLLAALVQTFNQWTGEQSLLVDLEGHGREAIANDIDLSRTVGWFTSIFPVLLTLPESLEPGEALKVVKEQLRSIPNRGIGYGVLRYLSKDAQLQTLPQAEVRFNYLGQFDQALPESSLFKLVNQTPGASRSQADNRRYLIDINGFVLGGQLQLEWTYSEQIHKRFTIEQLTTGYVQALRSLITHCQSPEAGGYTPSDFPKAQLSQNDLDKLLSKLNKTGEKKSR
jgi:amino acid adenylation domain-containing protein/non-ribosomal peptide synthase protein (TIGR01720 family)